MNVIEKATAFEEEHATYAPIKEVQIDGLAVLKIVKHCHENFPTMVAGSLLGLDINGVLEITYSYPFPTPKVDGEVVTDAVDDLDSAEYQMEMMKMLRDVNIDNNCVGWYQSMYLGTICTNDVIGYQYNYQSSEELSENSIVIMYDPVLSRKGSLVLKAFRLTEQFIKLKASKLNKFIKPSDILEELPLKIRNFGLISAFLRTVQDNHANEIDCDFDALSYSNLDFYTEKHLELLSTWLEDLVQEQQKFHQYSRAISKTRLDHVRWLLKRIQDNIEAQDSEKEQLSTKLEDSAEYKSLPEAPVRVDPLLMIGQLERYCSQLNEHVDSSVQKLYITSQLTSSS
jgi:translation initiation factor 3 subunit H